MRRGGLGLVSCLLGVGLVVGGVSPVWAAAQPRPVGESAVVGGFGLGDGLEGSFDEQTGSFGFGLPAGGLSLGWDSRAVGVDRHGLGGGWGFGLPFLQVEGGVTTFPAAGGAYPADESAPSGLAGYPLDDVRFEQATGVLPVRDDDGRGEVAYAYVLHELGGSTTYFSDTGDPVARVSPSGVRHDWRWAPGDVHRLVEFIDADGVSTVVTWAPERGELVVQPGANLRESGGSWVVQLAHGVVTAAVDPAGARTAIRSDASGLVTEIAGPSGARTAVQWRSHLDGVARVHEVRTLDAVGTELSSRAWRPVAEHGLSTGWPVTHTMPGTLGGGGTFSTVVGDGSTEVESTYNALGSLIRRVTTGTTGSGRVVLKEQAFRYPGTDEHGTPTVRAGALPAHWTMPTSITATVRDARGAERSVAQLTEFDEYGRLIAQTGVDGVAHTYTYDQPEPGAVNPPIGLQTGERSVAPDGLVSEVKYDLNDERTAVIAATEYAGRDGEPLVVTGRTEYTVEADGFVSERREFPAETGEADGGPATAAPRVTRWSQATDLAAGELTMSETIGAGTPAETSRTSTTSLLHSGLLSQTDAAGRETVSAAYDRLGRVVSSTDSAGRTTTTTYETAQHDGRNAVTVTGPDGVAVTEVRDVLGRVTQLTDNIDDGVATTGHVRVVETRAYPAPGELRVTDAWGAVSSKREDVFGRTVETVAPTGLRTVAVHDDIAGTVTTGATPSGDLADAESTSTTTTDLTGRVTEHTGTRADGVEVPTVGAVYDGFGREVATTGGFIQSTTTYDDYGRIAGQTHSPTSTSEATGITAASATAPMSVSHEFDAFGAPLQKTVDNGDAAYSGVKQTLDELGRTATETDQAGITTSYDYTSDGLVARSATSTGQVTELTYDDARQLLRSTRTDSDGGAPVVTEYERDPATGQVTAMFDPADRAGTELSYTYDAFGNTLTTTYPDGKQITRGYDPHGRLETTTDITGNTTRYTYDDAGLMVAAVQTAENGEQLASIAYTYDVYGRVVTADRGNGVRTAYEYSSANEPTRELTTTNGVVTADREYTYDVAGRVIARTDRVPESDDPDQLTATTTTYVYDGFDKLVVSTVHDGDTTDAPVTTTTRYQNTLAGDVARETVTERPGTPEEQTTERAFEYTPSGELTAVTTTNGDRASEREAQAYDHNGNLVRDLDNTTYTYDAANRVTSHTAADGSVTRTDYWADGSRRGLTATDTDGDEAKTGFYWAGDTLLNDTHTGTGDPGTAGTASYLFGTTRHARTVTTGQGDQVEHHTRYLGTDRHSNTTELTDERGDVTTRYTYTDYGTTTTTDPTGDPIADDAAPVVGDATRNPIQYAAGYTDPSGRQHLDARDYNAATMRFDTPDPAPMLTNYAYAGLNPIMKVDPSGRSEIGDYVINGTLAGVGAASAGWTIARLGAPSLAALGPAGLFWWSVAFVAVIGDLVSTGIAVAELVHDSGLKTFIHDHDREALTVAGIAIGAVAAALGPVATKLKDHYKAARARHNAPVDPVSDSNDEEFVAPSDTESESLEGDPWGYARGGEPETGGNVALKGRDPSNAGKARADTSNTVIRHGPDDSSSSDTLESDDEVERIATTTKYSGLTDDEAFAMFITDTEANMAVLGPRFSGRTALTTLTGLLRNPVASDGTKLTQRFVWDCYVTSRYQPLETISARLIRRHPTAPPGHQRAIRNITTDIAAMRQRFR